MRKEGEAGRRKLTQYSRMGAVRLAVFQAFGIATRAAERRPASVVYDPGPGFVLTAVVALTAGTMFLMWLGEQITERGIGNGVSLIIFAGIVAGLPAAVVNTLEQARNGDIDPALVVIVIIAIVLGVHLLRGVRRARPAPDHGELRAPPGRPARRT